VPPLSNSFRRHCYPQRQGYGEGRVTVRVRVRIRVKFMVRMRYRAYKQGRPKAPPGDPKCITEILGDKNKEVRGQNLVDIYV